MRRKFNPSSIASGVCVRSVAQKPAVFQLGLMSPATFTPPGTQALDKVAFIAAPVADANPLATVKEKWVLSITVMTLLPLYPVGVAPAIVTVSPVTSAAVVVLAATVAVAVVPPPLLSEPMLTTVDAAQI